MFLHRAVYSPLARVGLWLPLGTVGSFLALAALGVVGLPITVLAVTFLAALGWVAFGVGGGGRGRMRAGGASRVSGGSSRESDGNFRASEAGSREAHSGSSHGPHSDSSHAISPSTGLLTYLTATTALGWAVLLLVGP